jgi:hypothetical protein
MCAYWDDKQCGFWVFNFLCTEKSFFFFRMPKMVFVVVKNLPRNHFKIGPAKISQILYHILGIIHQLVAYQKIFRYRSTNRQIPTDLRESGSNLNYRRFIVCSWFFPKIIFRYTISYFISDPQRLLFYFGKLIFYLSKFSSSSRFFIRK